MDNKHINMVLESYMACMENKATDEQKLIWSLANAINCIKARLAMNDMEYVNKILCEYDYKINE